MKASDVINELKDNAHPRKAEVLSRFFKTGKGEYAEGDVFLGVMVPESRKIAKKYNSLSYFELQKLLASDIHEARLTALLILVDQYAKMKTESEKTQLVHFYLRNVSRVNNWDLVDLSAPKIFGEFALEFSSQRRMLDLFATSRNLWQRRIAIVATFAFIRKNKFSDTLRIAFLLMKDKHDLIQKAVGWMLREVGKKDEKVLESFLKKYHKIMPRTMLRYSLERFSSSKKKLFMTR